MGEIGEAKLIAKLQQKDPVALEYVMNTYGKAVYSLAFNILKDLASSEDIEECVSDVFVAAWERSCEYDPARGTLKTWLLLLTKYKALDYRRKIYGDRKIVREEREEAVSPRQLEEMVLTREEIKQVIDCLGTMTELDQKIFYHRYFFYESADSIARRFNLTIRAVENRLWRIRKRIKESCEVERVVSRERI